MEFHVKRKSFAEKEFFSNSSTIILYSSLFFHQTLHSDYIDKGGLRFSQKFRLSVYIKSNYCQQTRLILVTCAFQTDKKH